MTGQNSNILKCNKRKKVEKLQPRLFKEPCGFTQISNDTLNGIDDVEVLGVYCYLAGRPQEWDICKTQLRNYFKLGVNKIDAIFTRLRYLGLLELIPTKNEKGKITRWDYYLKNHINICAKTTPMDSIPMDSIPMENTPPINKEYINKENNNKESITFSNTKETEKPLVPVKAESKSLTAKKSESKNPLAVLQKENVLNLSDEFLTQLIQTRKQNKAMVTDGALKAVYQELIKLKKSGLDLDECLSMYANCGWKGFVADWFINAIKGKKNPHDFYTSDDTSWGDEMKNNPFYHGLLD